ncbi:hypothetical protein DFH28DRAFT_1172847 [Melampsora americana]|nr:hypothetical protein DFH28DRAFT_1172847 [Melampsora americana]
MTCTNLIIQTEAGRLTAIIQNWALPPEDEVIVIPDDDNRDLIKNYGVQLELFVSEEHDLIIIKNTIPNSPKTNKENTLPEDTDDLQGKCKQIHDAQTHCIVHQSPEIDSLVVRGGLPGFRPKTENQTASVRSFYQSESSLERSQSTPEAAESDDPEDSLHKSQASSSLDQSEDSSISIKKTQPNPERDSDKSRSRISVDPSLDPVNTIEESQPDSGADSSKREKTLPTVSQTTPIPRVLPSRKKMNVAVVIPRYTASNSKSKSSKISDEKKKKGCSRATNTKEKSVKFFMGSAHQEQEVIILLSPYTSNQTSKVAKLAAWEALDDLLEGSPTGELLNQVFLDSIDDGTDNVVVKTKFNAQIWFEAIEITIWYHTWRSMPMFSSFLTVLLDSVLLTGKLFLKDTPATEEKRAMTGINAVCQEVKWLNSQKTTEINNANTMRLTIQTIVIDSYVVQYFEANYILDEEASP